MASLPSVDRLRLDATAPEPTGPQVRRPRGLYDDDSDLADEPPRQIQRTRAQIVARLPPLAEDTAKARFVTLPDEVDYPDYIAKELVNPSILPTPYDLAWAKWCTAKDERDAAVKKSDKAEAKRVASERAFQQNATTANQRKRDAATAAAQAAKTEAEAAVERTGDAEAEKDRNLTHASLNAQYHKNPYEILAKRVRLKRQEEAGYEVLAAQLPPLSDPRNLGVAVYEVFESDKERWDFVQSMQHAVDNTPEFAEQTWREGGSRAGEKRSLFEMTQTNIAAGGFAALNHPSSFHNQFVRSLRMHVHGQAVFGDFFGMGTEEGANSESTHLEQVIDRMMIRRSNQAPTAEAWHRDVAVGTRKDDRVFGGWINLNNFDQTFSCVLGSSHEKRDASDPVGFATIDSVHHPQVVARSSKVVIPSGCMIVFNEDTIHEVSSSTQITSLLRLFTGWRLSRWNVREEPEPLIVDLDRRLKDQEGMPLKSGQHKHYFEHHSDENFQRSVPEARKFHPITNPTGLRYYPGPPPFFPSAYWGQLDPSTVARFCEILKPELVHTRFFNPETSKIRSEQFPNGVKCNLDLYSAPSGHRFNPNDTPPHKPDTLRGLKETRDWMDVHYRNGEVAQWMQEDYEPEEVEILKPRTLQALRRMLASPTCAVRASASNRATTSAETNGPLALLAPEEQ
jgi:hypothetical protein